MGRKGKKNRKSDSEVEKAEVRIIKNKVVYNNFPQFPVSKAYSQSTEAQNLIFVSAVGPNLPDGTIDEELYKRVWRTFENLKSVAEASGTALKYAVQLDIYLANIGCSLEFIKVKELINKVIGELWEDHCKPARGVLAVVTYLPYSELTCGPFLNVSGIFLNPSFGFKITPKMETLTSTCSTSSSSCPSSSSSTSSSSSCPSSSSSSSSSSTSSSSSCSEPIIIVKKK